MTFRPLIILSKFRFIKLISNKFFNAFTWVPFIFVSISFVKFDRISKMHNFKDIHTFWVHGSTMFFPLILLRWAIFKKILGSAQQQNKHCDRNRSIKGDCWEQYSSDLPPLKHEWFVWRWQHRSPDGSYPQVALPRSEFSSVESRAAGYSFCESGV